MVLLLLLCWFSGQAPFNSSESFLEKDHTKQMYPPDVSSLSMALNDLKMLHNNPEVQHIVNPVPEMINNLGSTKWYPQTNPRRVDSIMDPMNESKLYDDLIYNRGNMFTVNTLPMNLGPHSSIPHHPLSLPYDPKFLN